MTALTADAPRALKANPRIAGSHPVKAATKIFAGGYIGLDGTGHARPIEANDTYVGIARDQVDNLAGADGDKQIEIWEECVPEVDVTGIAGVTDVDAPTDVFAEDDNTLHTTDGGGTRPKVGRVVEFVGGASGTRVFVHALSETRKVS